MNSLSEFPDSVGVQILEHFADADMRSVRNKSAFLAGVMRRFRNEHKGPYMGGGGGGMMGGGGYGGYGGPPPPYMGGGGMPPPAMGMPPATGPLARELRCLPLCAS